MHIQSVHTGSFHLCHLQDVASKIVVEGKESLRKLPGILYHLSQEGQSYAYIPLTRRVWAYILSGLTKM